MKQRIAAAREGIDWLRGGARAFARQPVALIGLPLMLAALLAFVGMLPLAGPLLALALLPAGTVGLMEAARQAMQGRFPSPAVLLTALRNAPQGARQILLLGLLYLDVHDGLDRRLSRGDEVGSRAHGAGREGSILEAVVRGIATRIGSAVYEDGRGGLRLTR